MTQKEFAVWTAAAESSRHNWTEDEIYRLNGRGAMYYLGGENGVYMRIDADGKLDFGDYVGAIPHIGEATFKSIHTEQHADYSKAFAAALELGGKKFFADMFSGHKERAINIAEEAFERKESIEVKTITAAEVKSMTDREGLILQGCGGDLNEWVIGINDTLTEAGILRNGARFTDVSAFEHDGLTNLLFSMDGVDLNVGELAMWRLRSHDTFGGTWLSDYIPNRLGGIAAANETPKRNREAVIMATFQTETDVRELDFPQNPAELDKTVAAVGDARCVELEIGDCLTVLDEANDVREINRLAELIEPLGDTEREQYVNLLDAANCVGVRNMTYIADNFHKFDIVPDVGDTAELGKWYVENEYPDLDPILYDHLDFDSLGDQALRDELTGRLTDSCYVANFDEVMRGMSEQDMDMQMGGMQ